MLYTYFLNLRFQAVLNNDFTENFKIYYKYEAETD